MKVLMTCDAVGGVWQYAHDLAGGLTAQGVEVVLAVLGPVESVTICHPRESGDPSPVFRSLDEGGNRVERTSWAPAFAGVTAVETNLPLDWLATGPDQVHATGRAIAALAAEHRVDLIHLNAPALAAAQAFPAPVVAVAHGCIGTWFAGLGEEPGPDLAWHADLMRAGLHAADAVVAPSHAFGAAVARRYGLATPPRVVHNGRTLAAMTNAKPADHVLTAGRLWDRAKDTALLDATAALLPVPLRAAGPVTGPHGETVEARHLRLLGNLSAEALAAEYASQPIFVSAARFEPFGLAVLEAAQAGCPLILSDIDTFRELWNGAALIVPARDPAAWTAAIERVRGDAVLRAHLSTQARQRAARYTVDAMTSATLTAYRELLPAERRAA